MALAMSREFHTAIGNNGHPGAARGFNARLNRRDLRHAGASHDARGAYRSGPNANFDRVDAASINSRAPSPVPTLPAISCVSG